MSVVRKDIAKHYLKKNSDAIAYNTDQVNYESNVVKHGITEVGVWQGIKDRYPETVHEISVCRPQSKLQGLKFSVALDCSSTGNATMVELVDQGVTMDDGQYVKKDVSQYDDLTVYNLVMYEDDWTPSIGTTFVVKMFDEDDTLLKDVRFNIDVDKPIQDISLGEPTISVEQIQKIVFNSEI